MKSEPTKATHKSAENSKTVRKSSTSSVLKQRKRTMTSAQVFSLFIERDSGIVNGEGILSQECFQLWLGSRNKKVLHPEESFRRTLIAHIRGVYGRKPFNSYVELSLLKLLRKPVGGGETSNFDPWGRCFPGNALHIGKRGFNKLGYNEQANQESKQILQQPLKQEDGSTQKQFLKQEEDSAQSSGRRNIPKRTDFISWFPSNGALRLLYTTSILHIETTSGWLGNLSLSLTRRYSFDELSNLFDSLKHNGFELLNPSVLFYLKQCNPFEALNLPLWFIFPSSESFYQHKITGRLLLSLKKWLVVDQDNQSRALLMRDIKGHQIIDVVDSSVGWLILFPRLLHLLEEHASFWLRLKLLKGNGTVGIFVIEAQLKSDDYVVFLLQDHTEHFGSLSNTPQLA